MHNEIPAEVWKAEPRHPDIWKNQGKCVSCTTGPRYQCCRFCGDPMCQPCLTKHVGSVHAREAYIERLALTRNLVFWNTATEEERMEAVALRIKWQDEQKESEIAMSAAG